MQFLFSDDDAELVHSLGLDRKKCDGFHVKKPLVGRAVIVSHLSYLFRSDCRDRILFFIRQTRIVVPYIKLQMLYIQNPLERYFYFFVVSLAFMEIGILEKCNT